jgi:chemotaxis protein MotA
MFSIGTLIGILAGIGLLIYAVFNAGAEDPAIFLNLNSFLIVFGGTIAATFIAFKEIYVFRAFAGMINIFKHLDINSKTLYDDVGKIIAWGEIMRKGGLNELRNKFDDKEYSNPIIKYSMEMLFSGAKSEDILNLTSDLIETRHERDNIQVEVLDAMASFAPAFGMIGTLVGLVALLTQLDNIDAIGGGMAIALMTTLYGVLLANLILKPAARKLEQNFSIIKYRDTILMEGISMLPKKPHPYTIQDHLNRLLDPANHFDIAER